MKRLTIIILVAAAFLIGYGTATQAWPIKGRNAYYGYFGNTYDDDGTNIFPTNSNTSGCAASGGNAIPTSVNTASEFISFINCKLNSNNSNTTVRTQERTGAAFIIQTMIGQATNKPPTSAQITEWQDRVNYYASVGQINWNSNQSYTINTFYQGTATGSNPQDDAFFEQTGSGASIVFGTASAQPYVLKFLCANPVGNGNVGTTDSIPWTATGRTTVSDGSPDAGDTSTAITTTPGATLHFDHYIKNNGPGTSSNWYALYGHNNQTSYTGQYFSNKTLSGSPTLTRTDYPIDFSWSGSPGGSVPADGFSVRWTKTDYFTAGSYTFTATADDGVRLYVDGALTIDAWVNQSPTAYSATKTMTAGNHTVVWEYYDNTSGAVASFNYYYLTQTAVSAGATFASGSERIVDSNDVVVPSNAVDGTLICRRILWDWKNSAATGDTFYGTAGMGAPACATVSASYDLAPTVSVASGSSIVQTGDVVQFVYRVTNSGSATSPSITCTAKDGGGATVTVPGMTCPQTFAPGPSPGTTVATENFTVTNQSPGTTICRTLTVAPGAPGVSSRVSQPACVTVAKTPYVTFLGGDVWSGGGFAAVSPGTCTAAGKITTAPVHTLSDSSKAGSGVAYGAFALGKITNFGSASLPLTVSTGTGDAWTFSNINTNNLGFFGAPQHCITDYVAGYTSAPTLAGGLVVDVGTQASGAWHVTGGLTIHGTMPAGSTQVYLVDGDVDIDADIKYPATYTNAASIPSLVIISRHNLHVLAAVRQADGIYEVRGDGSTTGIFRTCWPRTEPQTVSTCANQLTINGAVMVGALDLFRTAGADGTTPATQKNPAEIFNMTPEVYIKNALSQTTQTTITTNSVRELPPRF